MVSTRRTESGGSPADAMSRLSRRLKGRGGNNSDSSEGSNTDLEQSQEEDSWSSQYRPRQKRSNTGESLRVRELRNRFVCSVGLAARKNRQRPSNPYHTPQTRHEMPEDSDSNFLIQRKIECDEIFSPERYKRRFTGHSTGRKRIRLRPLKSQCYADPHSSMHSSGTDNEHEKNENLRRSKRQRKLQYRSFNTSWITEAQVVRGYPNLKSEFLSDQDSRHSQDNGLHENRKSSRREIKKNMKYMYDYETNEMTPRRIRSRSNEEHNGIDEENLKNEEEEEENTKPEKKTVENPEESEEHGSEEAIVNGVDNTNEDSQEAKRVTRKQEIQKNKKIGDGSESESEHEIRRPTRQRRLNYMDDPRFSPRRTRNRKISDSSDDDIRSQRYKYQLRQRKPNQTSIEVARRRRERRRDPSSSDNSMSEDERPRARKSSKARNRAAGTSDLNVDGKQLKSGQSGAPMPIGPETLDKDVKFSSVGGLDNHVRCLREMVVLPMMYPEVFHKFHVQPPRGILFHGPPGTGKTLLARALASECSFGSRKVSFFVRKGADLLSKWVGESEKQLRLLFEQAQSLKPSIIFFDELDGLAPVRSSKQDQIHASIVSTLLALMDGLDARGEVIVIGATNRIDAIDPALRRPGRFDRELFFPLPARREREEILKVHVSQWSVPPSEHLISHLAEYSGGYCGSDLRALCSEAVIQGLRRTYPQVYTTDYRLDLDPEQVQVEKVDFLRAKSLLIPASHRVQQSLGRRLPRALEPLLRKPLDTVLELCKETFPHGLDPALASIKINVGGMQTAQLLLTGDTHAQGQSTYLAPALLHHMEHVSTFTLDLAALYKETARSPEEACVDIFNEARRNVPCVIYVPSIEQWWSLVGETVRAIFLSQLSSLDPTLPILLLATANVEYKQLPEEVGSVFSTYRKEVLHLSPPVTAQREAFFCPLIIDNAKKPPKPKRERPKTPPPLPRASTPPPPPMTEAELQKLYEKEEQTLRELRIFLRDMCKKLASNRMFYIFTKPVDLEEAPDYLTIIKQPMDLESMMTKVDLHRYSSAQEFLHDIDLICTNALEYNPAKTPADKLIRHRACALRDHAYAMIKAEMDSDFEDKCRSISSKRKERKANNSQFVPEFIHTPDQPYLMQLMKEESNQSEPKDNIKEDSNDNSLEQKTESGMSRISPHRKRRVPAWARGYLGSRKRRRSNRNTLSESQQDDFKNDSNQKTSSGDESKENKPEVLTKDVGVSADTLFDKVEIEKKKTEKESAPLSVKCDQEKVSSSTPVKSPSKSVNDTFSPAIWPSYADLLEDTPHIEDEESNDNTGEDLMKINVVIDNGELDKVLSQAVSTTRGCSIMALMDLYGQLNKVVIKYARMNDRSSLPQELQREIVRFQEIQKRPQGSSKSDSPAS